MRTKFDPHYYHDHLLFLKKLGSHTAKSSNHPLLPSTSSQRETRSEWLLLTKYRILADVSRGYISSECMSSVNADGSNRLKKRNIKYIGYRESLRQRLTLREIGNEAYDCEQGDPRRAKVQKECSRVRPGDRCVMCNY